MRFLVSALTLSLMMLGCAHNETRSEDVKNRRPSSDDQKVTLPVVVVTDDGQEVSGSLTLMTGGDDKLLYAYAPTGLMGGRPAMIIKTGGLFDGKKYALPGHTVNEAAICKLLKFPYGGTTLLTTTSGVAGPVYGKADGKFTTSSAGIDAGGYALSGIKCCTDRQFCAAGEGE